MENWNSSVSLAVVLDGSESDSVSCFLQKLLPIWSRVKSHLSVHLLIPRQSKSCPKLRFSKNQNFSCFLRPPTTSLNISKITSYPVNLARNSARLFTHSSFILIADLDHFFSNLFEKRLRTLATNFFKEKENQKTVLVYRIFEVQDDYSKKFKFLTKKKLKDLLQKGKAREFHSAFSHGHKIPYLEEWLIDNSEGIQFYNE